MATCQLSEGCHAGGPPHSRGPAQLDGVEPDERPAPSTRAGDELERWQREPSLVESVTLQVVPVGIPPGGLRPFTSVDAGGRGALGLSDWPSGDDGWHCRSYQQAAPVAVSALFLFFSSVVVLSLLLAISGPQWDRQWLEAYIRCDAAAEPGPYCVHIPTEVNGNEERHWDCFHEVVTTGSSGIQWYGAHNGTSPTDADHLNITMGTGTLSAGSSHGRFQAFMPWSEVGLSEDPVFMESMGAFTNGSPIFVDSLPAHHAYVYFVMMALAVAAATSVTRTVLQLQRTRSPSPLSDEDRRRFLVREALSCTCFAAVMAMAATGLAALNASPVANEAEDLGPWSWASYYPASLGCHAHVVLLSAPTVASGCIMCIFCICTLAMWACFSACFPPPSSGVRHITTAQAGGLTVGQPVALGHPAPVPVAEGSQDNPATEEQLRIHSETQPGASAAFTAAQPVGLLVPSVPR